MIIDRFFVALGFKTEDKDLKRFTQRADQAKQSMLSFGNAIKAFAAGAAIKSAVSIGDSFEQNTIAISGFLEALNLTGAAEGMQVAAKTIEQIEAASAKLPGSAEEYIEVFRAGLPVLKGAMPGGSIDAMTDFTNRFAAIGKTLQVDAGQIGRDLSLLLGPTGRAGGNVLTFQRMLPFIRQLEGQAALTAESFNLMTQPQRLKLLQDALANPALGRMLDRSADSFDSMFGAAMSGFKKLVRVASAPIFEDLKKGISELTALIIDDKNELTDFGKKLVAFGRQAGRIITDTVVLFIQLGAGLGRLVSAGIEWLKKMDLLKSAIAALGVITLAAGAKMALGWIIGLGPITLGIAAIAALTAAVFFLRDHWDEVVETMQGTWTDFVNGLKGSVNEITGLFGFTPFDSASQTAVEQRTAELRANNERLKGILRARRAAAGTALMSSGAPMSSGAGTNMSTLAGNVAAPAPQVEAIMSSVPSLPGGGASTTTIDSRRVAIDVRPNINITTNDPKRAGDEAGRVIVTGLQKAYR